MVEKKIPVLRHYRSAYEETLCKVNLDMFQIFLRTFLNSNNDIRNYLLINVLNNN